MKKFWDWLETKQATSCFAIIAFIGGVSFIRLGEKSITGNAILANSDSCSLLSIIGLTLIICSIVLGAYSIKR